MNERIEALLPIVSILALAFSGCVTQSGPAPATADVSTPGGDGTWFWLNAAASPEGAITLFRWTPPNGSSSDVDDRGYRTLTFDYRPWVSEADRDAFVEWGFLVFDRFLDGPESGKARPQYDYVYPRGEEWEGFPVPKKQPYEPLAGRDAFSLRNRTGFDARPLDIIVLARATRYISFGLALDVLERRPLRSEEKIESMIPETPPPTPPLARTLHPTSLAEGFQFAVFYEVYSRTYSYAFQTPTIQVDRGTGTTTSPGPANRLQVSTTYDSPGGWVFSQSEYAVGTSVGRFSLSADYRGRTLAGAGPEAEVAGAVSEYVGSLGTLTHYVYRSGPGSSSYKMEIEYAESPQLHSAYLLKIDLATPIEELLQAPAYEHWQVESRVSPDGSPSNRWASAA